MNVYSRIHTILVHLFFSWIFFSLQEPRALHPEPRWIDKILQLFGLCHCYLGPFVIHSIHGTYSLRVNFGMLSQVSIILFMCAVD